MIRNRRFGFWVPTTELRWKFGIERWCQPNSRIECFVLHSNQLKVTRSSCDWNMILKWNPLWFACFNFFGSEKWMEMETVVVCRTIESIGKRRARLCGVRTMEYVREYDSNHCMRHMGWFISIKFDGIEQTDIGHTHTLREYFPITVFISSSSLQFSSFSFSNVETCYRTLRYSQHDIIDADEKKGKYELRAEKNHSSRRSKRSDREFLFVFFSICIRCAFF